MTVSDPGRRFAARPLRSALGWYVKPRWGNYQISSPPTRNSLQNLNLPNSPVFRHFHQPWLPPS